MPTPSWRRRRRRLTLTVTMHAANSKVSLPNMKNLLDPVAGNAELPGGRGGRSGETTGALAAPATVKLAIHAPRVWVAMHSV